MRLAQKGTSSKIDYFQKLLLRLGTFESLGQDNELKSGSHMLEVFSSSSQKYMLISDAHPSVCPSTMANDSGGNDVCDCHCLRGLMLLIKEGFSRKRDFVLIEG